jgi:predicted oxidoreductase
MPILLSSALALLLGLAFGGNVQAQLSGNNLPRFATNYAPSPRVSPYLNLVRDNNRSGVITPTYQTQVRPQLESYRQNQEQRAMINNLGRSLGQLQQRKQSGVAGVTGHPTRFMTYLHYYPTFGR